MDTEALITGMGGSYKGSREMAKLKSQKPKYLPMDKQLTKEEILWSFPQGESEPYGHVPIKRIYEAMDIHAKQRSIAFREWEENICTDWYPDGKPNERYGSEKLYELFEQHLQSLNNIQP